MDSSVVALPYHPWRGWFAGIIYVACAVAFMADLAYNITWAFGVLYIPLVCTAVLYRNPRCVWWLAASAIAMVVLGCFFPVANFAIASLMNRALSIAAILTTAALVRLARSMQDRLAWQTLRAQSADRMKTQIFANLSHELRTPLNAIIGFAELLLADCRPDQQISLEHLRSAGRRLLATIENLLDLAQAEDRALRAETFDVAAILHQAIDAARAGAAERGVTLATSIATDASWAIGDAWAVRRIADNLIGNAVKFTAHGGSVHIATEMADGSLSLVVEDTGDGMSAEVLRQLGEPFFQANSGADRPYQGMGTGLALCGKLADAMGATLVFASEPGRGTTVRLRLRAA
ncbi:MAG TPA: HAMP domain-containing sensor histidine kinase [Acetobacteraceae bacterium]|nr:HAMP domain-containing sensor histidine kinase [Acetobacteraceae bacterium]